MDTKGQLQQSAKDMRAMADKQRITKANVQKELDNLKKSNQSAQNPGSNSGTNDMAAQLDRQVRDMQRDIDNLERQARDIDKQARGL